MSLSLKKSPIGLFFVAPNRQYEAANEAIHCGCNKKRGLFGPRFWIFVVYSGRRLP